MNPYAIAPLISFIFLLAGAFYVIKKGAGRVFNWIFVFAILVLALVEFGNFMALISSNQMKALFWLRWVLAGLSFLPLSWTLLSLIFARENYQVSLRRQGRYLTLLSIATLGFLSFLHRESLIMSAKIVSGSYGFTLGAAGRYFFVFLLLSLVVILLNFENTYRFSKGKQRQSIKWTIRGIGIFIGAYVALSSLALLFSYIDVRFTIFGSIAIVIGFLLVSRSILRYGLADTYVYVGRQAVYTSATLSIVGLYLFMVGLIAKIIMSAGINLRTFFSLLAALFVFILFLTIVFSGQLKEKLRLFIDRSFYKGKYDYRREWGSFSEKISSLFSLDELLFNIADAIQKVMHIENISIMLLDESKNRFFAAKGSGNEIYFDKNSEFIDWLWRYAQPIEIESFSKKADTAKIYQANREKLEALGVSICVPLICNQKLMGILNVGKNPSGDRYRFSQEDLELLKRLADQAAVAISNAKLSEELIIASEMESLQKVSSFIIHDLKNFVSVLSMVVQNAAQNIDNPQFRKDSLDTISETIGKMNNLMSKVSSLPKQLELKLKPGDLNSLIKELVAKSKLEEMPGVMVVKELDKLPPTMFDYEYIYKVALNLVLNAVEAFNGQGGKVKISTNKSNGFVNLAISDTGCGMSKEYIQKYLFRPFKTTKKKGLGIGLYQCKTIVEAHAGRIEVDSQENKGSTFTVRLPTGVGYG